jgi:1-phosphofructokinase family hexose kinase
MILTVTANPAIDYTIRVDSLEIGRRGKYRDPVFDSSGKGINVSRMVRRLGAPTLALGFAGGPTGDLLRQGLDREGVPYDLVEVPGLTRVNVTVLSGPDGAATHLHGPGARVEPAQVAQLLGLAARHLPRATLLVVSGSLPPGVTSATIVELMALAKGRGIPAIVDVEGETLGAAIAAGATLVKPNLLEAGDYLGRRLAGVDDAVAAAKEIVARGAKTAVVTLRGEGAVGASDGRVWHATPPRDPVIRAIGAGDSFAAGLAVELARGVPLPEALRTASAAGAATALHSGTGLGSAEETARLRERTDVRERT